LALEKKHFGIQYVAALFERFITKNYRYAAAFLFKAMHYEKLISLKE